MRGLCVVGLITLWPAASNAQQAVERSPVPVPTPPAAALVIEEADPEVADREPLGVDLRAIRLIGGDETVDPDPPVGVSIGTIPDAPEERLKAALAPFVGRPLSMALIAEMQVAVARVWRSTGYPFVSVTIPPQEVTEGNLHLRLIEARVGELEFEGAEGRRLERLSSRIRLPARGDRIAARPLEEDLNWLNRVPQRNVQAIFAPGDQQGFSDLTFRVTEGRPVQFYGGWANSGSRRTDPNRFFMGGIAWLPELNDLTVSYQVTGSPDLWSNLARLVPRRGQYAAYLGHSGRFVLPTWPRQSLEFSPGMVASRENADAFTAFENTTVELPVIYRSAVSNLMPGLYLGDLYGGVEFKHVSRTTFFGGMEVARGQAQLFQLVVGWTHRFNDRWGHTIFDVHAKANPGGIVAGNDSATWTGFTAGRVSDVRYAYGGLDVTRTTSLPLGFALLNRFSGVLAGQPLPDTERMALGGFHATRGYGIDDATIDTGFFLRNELRLPAISPLSGTGLNDNLSTYVFADIGHGLDLWTSAATTIAGIGAGFDYDLGPHLSASLAAGYALHDAAVTRRGDWAVQARIVGRY